MIYAFFNEKSAFFGLVTRVHRHVSENAGATALATGTIALIGIGSVVFIALIVLLILNSRKKKKGNL